MIICYLSLGELPTEYNGQGDILDISREISELKNSLRLLQQKLDARNGMANTKTTRSRRGVEDGAQVAGNGCQGPGCSSSYTPYYSGQCFLCPAGTPGPRGPAGPQGIPGRDGRDGRDATAQKSVVNVSDAPENRLTKELLDQLLQTSRLTYPKYTNASGGAVYVRWGRNECSTYSELVYKGVAAGSHYTLKGSGSNILCMPDDPIYDEPIPGSSGQDRGYVYGAEYEMNTFVNWDHLHNNNVPCAVCWAPYRPSLLMVPARNVCPGSEWIKEYSGYLVSSYHNHEGRSEYTCMDRDPEVVPRTSHNADGLLFYVVESKCGASGSGLPCGPYVDGYELTCAVCTR